VTVTRAHECQPPVMIALTVNDPLNGKATLTGTSLSIVDALPNCPRVLLPQHFTGCAASSLTSAQAWTDPVWIAVTAEVSPVTG
jgi:hypothetical protein